MPKKIQEFIRHQGENIYTTQGKGEESLDGESMYEKIQDIRDRAGGEWGEENENVL